MMLSYPECKLWIVISNNCIFNLSHFNNMNHGHLKNVVQVRIIPTWLSGDHFNHKILRL